MYGVMICLLLGSGWLVAGVVGLLYYASKVDWDAEKARYDYTIDELIKAYAGVGYDEPVTENKVKEKAVNGRCRKKRISLLHQDPLMIPIKDKVEKAVKGWNIPGE